MVAVLLLYVVAAWLCVVAMSSCVSDEGMGVRANALLFGSQVTASDVAPGCIVRQGNGRECCASLPVLTEKKTVLDGDDILHCHCHGCITSVVTKKEPKEHMIDQKFVVKHKRDIPRAQTTS